MRAALAFAVLVFALFNPAMLPAASAAEQNAQAGATRECKTSKSNVTTCERQISQELRKQCRWKCSTSCPGGQCVEVCRGSGQECNGKTPPGW